MSNLKYRVFVAVFLVSCASKANLSSDLISDIMTFFSISFGFISTCAVATLSLGYVKDLDKKQDEKDPQYSLLDKAVFLFKESVYLNLSGIAICLIIRIFNGILSAYPNSVLNPIKVFMASALVAFSALVILSMVKLIELFFGLASKEIRTKK